MIPRNEAQRVYTSQQLFDAVKKESEFEEEKDFQAKHSFIRTWLAERKVKSLIVAQAQKRKLA